MAQQESAGDHKEVSPFPAMIIAQPSDQPSNSLNSMTSSAKRQLLNIPGAQGNGQVSTFTPFKNLLVNKQ
jgi:hypothetical protein